MEKLKEAIKANNTPKKNTTGNSDTGRTSCFIFGELPSPHP